jgi:hypothetical protein
MYELLFPFVVLSILDIMAEIGTPMTLREKSMEIVR